MERLGETPGFSLGIEPAVISMKVDTKSPCF